MIQQENKIKILENLSLTDNIFEIIDYFFNELNKNDSFEGANLYFKKTDDFFKAYKVKLPSKMKELEKVYQNSTINLKNFKNLHDCYTQDKIVNIIEENANDYDQSMKKYFTQYKIKQSITFPVSKNNYEPIGAITMMTMDNYFNEKDIDYIKQLIMLFYCPLSSALKMEKMIQDQKEVENAKNRYQRLLKLSAQINLLVDPDELFQLMIKEMLDIFGYQLGFIQIENDGRLPFVSGYAIEDGESSKVLEDLDEYFSIHENSFKIYPPLNEESGACCLAYINNTYFYFENTESLKKLPMAEKDKIAMSKCVRPLKSFIQMPIREYEKPIGILQLWSFDENIKLQETDINMISSLCSFIPSVLKNADLHSKVEDQKIQLEKLNNKIEIERDKSDKLLLNILPKVVADELKEKGKVIPEYYESVSVMFTDFQGFTKISENMTPHELVSELDNYFSVFDEVSEKYGIEKLKTIGDSYMCAGGIPLKNNTHPVDIILAALEIQNLMLQMKKNKESLGESHWSLRLGIHTGPLVAGVIGDKKFVYDIWGDTVNTASRMESSGINEMINISEYTKNLVEDFFMLEHRGEVTAKNKGKVNMYFVKGIKPRLSVDGNCKTPNDRFYDLYNSLKNRELNADNN